MPLYVWVYRDTVSLFTKNTGVLSEDKADVMVPISTGIIQWIRVQQGRNQCRMSLFTLSIFSSFLLYLLSHLPPLHLWHWRSPVQSIPGRLVPLYPLMHRKSTGVGGVTVVWNHTSNVCALLVNNTCFSFDITLWMSERLCSFSDVAVLIYLWLVTDEMKDTHSTLLAMRYKWS